MTPKDAGLGIGRRSAATLAAMARLEGARGVDVTCLTIFLWGTLAMRRHPEYAVALLSGLGDEAITAAEAAVESFVRQFPITVEAAS